MPVQWRMRFSIHGIRHPADSAVTVGVYIRLSADSTTLKEDIAAVVAVVKKNVGVHVRMHLNFIFVYSIVYVSMHVLYIRTYAC